MLRFLLMLIVFIPLTGCGTDGGLDGTVVYIGTVHDTAGQPASELHVTLFETAETATTDETGEFIIDSFRRFESAGFFFQSDSFTNTVRVDHIPSSAEQVQLRFTYEPETNSVSIASIEFDGGNPAVTPAPPGPDPTPGDPGSPGPRPTPSPTPRPGNFDQDGNTNNFGIPAGLTGNISRGRVVWSSICSSCHVREKTNKAYGDVQRALNTIPDMRSVRISRGEIADVTAYLNRGRR